MGVAFGDEKVNKCLTNTGNGGEIHDDLRGKSVRDGEGAILP